MKKSEFIASVAEKAELSKAAAARAVDAIFDSTSGAIADAVRATGQLSLPGFGRFKSKTRPARQGRNPQTGAPIDIPEKQTVAFSAGKGLQEALKGGSSAKKSGATKKSATAKKSASKSAPAKGGAAKKSSSGAKGKK